MPCAVLLFHFLDCLTSFLCLYHCIFFSLEADGKNISAAKLKVAFPPNSPDTGSVMRSNSLGPDNVNTGTTVQSGRAEARATGKPNKQFSNKYHQVLEPVDL